MAYDPNDPSYDPSPGLPQGMERSATGRLRAPEVAAGMRETSKMWRELGKAIKRKQKIDAVKNVFKEMGKITVAGARELAKSMEMMKSLMGMPGRTAVQGLDMLGSSLVGPISGALSQAIGQFSMVMNQTLGPILQQLGAAVGGFISQNRIGAGIGGTIGAGIGGIAGTLTGIPALGPLAAMAGGLIGGGIEALVSGIGTPPAPDVMESGIEDTITQLLARGISWEFIWQNLAKNKGLAMKNLGISSARDLKDWYENRVPSAEPEEDTGLLVGMPTGGGGMAIAEWAASGGDVGVGDTEVVVATRETNTLLKKLIQIEELAWVF